METKLSLHSLMMTTVTLSLEMPEHHLISGMATPDGPSSSGFSHGLLMPAC